MQTERFLTYLLSEKRSSPHTIESYKNDLGQFIAYCSRSYDIDQPQQVTQQVVRSWLASLMEEKYKAASVHRKLSSVNAFFHFLMKTNEVVSNPARAIPKPKLPKRLPVFVDEASAGALYEVTARTKDPSSTVIDSFSDLRDTLIVTLLYETGIRRSELINLKDSDMDFSIGQIKVLGKRNKMRYVPIGAEMSKRVKQYLESRNAQEFPEMESSLLRTDTGKKISKTFVYLKVKSYLSQVTTIERKSPHVLRHTFATHMLNNGADLNVIKEILGHSSLAATQVYTHNSIEKLKSIHKRMHPRNN